MNWWLEIDGNITEALFFLSAASQKSSIFPTVLLDLSFPRKEKEFFFLPPPPPKLSSREYVEIPPFPISHFFWEGEGGEKGRARNKLRLSIAGWEEEEEEKKWRVSPTPFRVSEEKFRRSANCSSLSVQKVSASHVPNYPAKMCQI